MARQRIDPNLYIPAGEPDAGTLNPNYGIAPAAEIGLSTDADGTVYDLFLANQGEGAVSLTLTWDTTAISSVFMPPHAHRPSVTLSTGDVVDVDTLDVLHLVVTRPGSATPADTMFSAVGEKKHKTAASTGNDYVVIGAGIRADA